MPFLWGRYSKAEVSNLGGVEKTEQADWIGFLGYEVRYTGEVRVRRDSLNEKFKTIKRKYHTGSKTSIARGEYKKDIEAEIINRIERFKTIAFATAKSLNENKYFETQNRKLSKYAATWLYKLLYKIAKNNNLSKEELERYWRIANS